MAFKGKNIKISGKATLLPKKNINSMLLGPSLTGIVNSAARIVLGGLQDRFLSEKTPSGDTWPPSGAAEVRARGGVGSFGRRGGTLFDTGQLFSSLGILQGESNPHLKKVGVRPLPVRDDGKSNFDIGIEHNFGVDQIKREFIGLAQADIRAVEDMLEHVTTKDLRLTE